jgi:hypothetical protein
LKSSPELTRAPWRGALPPMHNRSSKKRPRDPNQLGKLIVANGRWRD